MIFLNIVFVTISSRNFGRHRKILQVIVLSLILKKLLFFSYPTNKISVDNTTLILLLNSIKILRTTKQPNLLEATVIEIFFRTAIN